MRSDPSDEPLECLDVPGGHKHAGERPGVALVGRGVHAGQKIHDRVDARGCGRAELGDFSRARGIDPGLLADFRRGKEAEHLGEVGLGSAHRVRLGAGLGEDRIGHVELELDAGGRLEICGELDLVGVGVRRERSLADILGGLEDLQLVALAQVRDQSGGVDLQCVRGGVPIGIRQAFRPSRWGRRSTRGRWCAR